MILTKICNLNEGELTVVGGGLVTSFELGMFLDVAVGAIVFDLFARLGKRALPENPDRNTLFVFLGALTGYYGIGAISRLTQRGDPAVSVVELHKVVPKNEQH